MYLICYVALQNLLIEESCKYMDESSSLYISTLVSLVNIGIVMVEIYCFWFVTWAQGNMFKQLCKSMGGLYSRIVTIFPCLVSIGLVQVEIKSIEYVWTSQDHVTKESCHFFEWEPPQVCHHKYYGSMVVMLLVCQVI